jgi:hypothetical protein
LGKKTTRSFKLGCRNIAKRLARCAILQCMPLLQRPPLGM